MTRLITFLGTGKYSPACYRLDGQQEHHSRFVADALARLLKVTECHVLATEKAWDTHGQALREHLPDDIVFERRPIPDGQSEKELWQQFEELRDAITEGKPSSVVLDITHGFRAQPFFAAGVLAQLAACGQLPGEVQVFYGEYRGEDEEAPIWDLSLFLDLLEWAQGTTVMRETGNGQALVKLLRQERKRQARQLAQAGERRFPRTEPLIKAIEKFSDDLATVRIASLITGYAQEEKRKPDAVSSAQVLLDAVAQYRGEVESWLPALLPFLETLQSVAKDLPATGLLGADGLRAMQALAQRYIELGRPAEAAIVLREGWISAFAHEAREVEVNSSEFSKTARESLESRWRSQLGDDAKSLAKIRNDLQHGGFNEQPVDGSHLRKQVSDWVGKFGDVKPSPSEVRSNPTMSKVWFVTRHSGAVDWARRKGIGVDHLVSHLDIGAVSPGDEVLGTLPVNMIAKLNEKGVLYGHLSLDLPAEYRGRELSADELEKFNATIEYFAVKTEGVR